MIWALGTPGVWYLPQWYGAGPPTPEVPGIPACLIRRKKPRRTVFPALRIGETDTMAMSVIASCV